MNQEDFLQFFLPDDILADFKVMDITTSKSGDNTVMRVQLDEKLRCPDNYSEGDLQSKGFLKPVCICDFPVRDKAVTLIIRRRVWVNKKGETKTNSYDLIHDGTRYTKGFADFLKERD